VYHYLVAEAFRHHRLSYEKFWALGKTQQAELIWEELFLRHSPVSEPAGGAHHPAGPGPGCEEARSDVVAPLVARQRLEDHVTRVMAAAGVSSICMTNSPFDDQERAVWERAFVR